MNDGCCPAPAAEPADPASTLCPGCGTRGVPVSVRLLKHQLRPEQLAKVAKGDAFHFCANPVCDVVYHARDRRRFVTADLRWPVTQKATGADRPLCYCFGFTEGIAREELATTGCCTIPERIKAEIKARHCACEIRNPQGSCCLGNVTAAIRALQNPGATTVRPPSVS